MDDEPTQERRDHATPAGGVYSIAYYQHDGRPVPRRFADAVLIVEYDSAGRELMRTFGRMTPSQELPTARPGPGGRMALLIRIVVIALGLWVATLLVPGIVLTAAEPGPRIATLIGVALLFGLVNAVLKPVIKVVGCPFYVLTLGLIGLVVNALLFLLVGWLAGGLGLGFEVDGFWPAFLGAIVVAVVGFVAHLVVPDRLDRR